MSKKVKKPNAKKFFSDFKAFITKGNIIDLAIAVVVGGAFGKIVTSLVNDIIMPLVSLLTGGVSVADWKWIISPAEYGDGGILVKAEAALTYGKFLQTIIDFLIIAFFIFLALRLLMSLQGQLNKLEKNIAFLSKKETKRLYKSLKAQGLSKEQIELKIKEREEEKQAGMDAAKVEADAVKPETMEDLLRDIRELLRQKK